MHTDAGLEIILGGGLAEQILSEDDQHFLQHIQQAYSADATIRAAWLQHLPRIVEHLEPRPHDVFVATLRRILAEDTYLSMVKPWKILSSFLLASRVLWPDKERCDGMNTVLHRIFSIFPDILRPMIASSEGRMSEFVSMIAGSGGLFFNYGELEYLAVADDEVRLRYHDHPFAVERHFVPGFWQGCADFFAQRPRVDLEAHEPMRFDVVFKVASHG